MSERTRRFAVGLLWTGGHQAFEAVASLAVMLVLVRIIPPSEYGRATAAIGIIAFLNLLSARAFIEHALQVSDTEQVPWPTYWGLMWYFQVALFILGNLIAFGLSAAPALQAVAPLVHLATLGFLIDGMAHLSLTMMRRSLDISRLRVVLSVSVGVKLAGTLAGALAGWGAAAIIVGGNILPAVPLAFSLFFVERFRPQWPAVAVILRSREVFRYGSRRTAGGVLGGVRSLIEGLLLPTTIGLEALGLVGRAQALFSVTVGRIIAAFNDTTFPFVARAADDGPRLARWSGMQLFGALVLGAGGGMFVMTHGVDLVAVLYGEKWAGVVPLLVPGVTAAGAASIVATSVSLLLASRRVSASVLVDGAAVAVGIIAALTTFVMSSADIYLWTLAVGGLSVAGIALVTLARTAPTYPRVAAVVVATGAAGMAGAGASYFLLTWLGSSPAPTRLVVSAVVFAAVASVVLWAILHAYLLSMKQTLWSLWKVPRCNQLQNV